MIDTRLLREDPDRIRDTLEKRHYDLDLEPIADLDASRRKLLYKLEQVRAAQNRASAEIGRRKKAGEDVSVAAAEMKEVGCRTKTVEEQLRKVEGHLRSLLLTIPNLLHDSVPVGADDTANRVERQWGAIPEFDFEPQDHVAIGQALGIIDFEAASKMSGARFSLMRGAGAQLERALITFMLDTQTREHGYVEILPPFMVNSDSMTASGQLPKFAEESFRVDGRDLWLIPTAEVPLANLHRDEILPGDRLPLKYTAYTACFRSEAGSYGKDTRGMLRQHQFNKVELFKFTTPEQSWDELEGMTRDAEVILQKLGLPYQVVALSTGDLGFAAAMTYDLEVWLPGQDRYREVSSCSNCTDFQARRANIRFRRDKKPELVHTLNGSGLAAGRTFIAILENFQQEDGTVVIPEVLRPYMDGLERIEPGQ